MILSMCLFVCYHPIDSGDVRLYTFRYYIWTHQPGPHRKDTQEFFLFLFLFLFLFHVSSAGLAINFIARKIQASLAFVDC